MLRMQGNLVLFKTKRVWNGLCWRDNRFWRKFGKFKILQIRYYRNISLHLRHGIFRSCHSICWGFLATLMLQAKSNLCDFSLVRTDCVRNGDSCILHLIMLSNSSQRGFDKVTLISTWHWCHRCKFQTYFLSNCLFYKTPIKANM